MNRNALLVFLTNASRDPYSSAMQLSIIKSQLFLPTVIKFVCGYSLPMHRCLKDMKWQGTYKLSRHPGEQIKRVCKANEKGFRDFRTEGKSDSSTLKSEQHLHLSVFSWRCSLLILVTQSSHFGAYGTFKRVILFKVILKCLLRSTLVTKLIWRDHSVTQNDFKFWEGLPAEMRDQVVYPITQNTLLFYETEEPEATTVQNYIHLLK